MERVKPGTGLQFQRESSVEFFLPPAQFVSGGLLETVTSLPASRHRRRFPLQHLGHLEPDDSSGLKFGRKLQSPLRSWAVFPSVQSDSPLQNSLTSLLCTLCVSCFVSKKNKNKIKNTYGYFETKDKVLQPGDKLTCSSL